MSQLLPRYTDHHAADQQAIARAILASDTTPTISTTAARCTLAGDERRLRGIPIIARGVPGTSPGTRPGTNLDRNS